MEKINSLKNYLRNYNIIDDIEHTKEEFINITLTEIKSENSKLNNLIENLIEENKVKELEELGLLLKANGLKMNFDIQRPKIDSLETFKMYLRYSDEGTCANKGSVIKSLVKANDLEGIEILLNNNFITSRNIDKYLNFAINSGKYNVVPKLIERKNS
ncbi:MAG: hypothetical protein ACRC6T_09450 [Sarcina sp.]